MNWIESLNDVMGLLKPELDRRAAAAAVDVAQRRRDLIAERSTLAAKAEKMVAASTRTADKLKASVVDAQVALSTAQARHDEGCRQAAGELWPVTQRIATIESELWNSQPAGARGVVMRTLALCEPAQKMAAEIEGYRWDGGRAVTWSNHEQVRRRLDAIMAAVPVVRAWATECVDEDDLERKFAQLVESLPAVDEAPRRWPDVPQRAPRPCPAPGCNALVHGPGRCAAHGGPTPRYRWGTDRRPDVVRVLKGRTLQSARAALFAREPLCRACAAAGRVTAATVRDHVRPLAEGGLDVEANVQPLCQACSDRKTHGESMRGRQR